MTSGNEIAATFHRRLLDDGFRGNINTGVPLSPLTFYRIGGPALIFAEASCVDDLSIIRNALGDHPLESLILGAGSNILISDAGFPGLVVRLGKEFTEIKTEPENISVDTGASVPLLKLIREGTEMGMAGIERLAGIPGWVGGALYMNAGTFGEHIGDLVEFVEILTVSSEVKRLSPGDCEFAYRSSRFMESDEIILNCRITGEPEDSNKIADEIDRRLERRRRTQPVDIPSCGCAFKNPEGEKSAAQLIQEAGLKGASSGDAVISEIHANFIVNEGNARATDVISLMALAQKRVFNLTGVKLDPEVRTAGFEKPIEVILDEWKSD